MITFVAIVFGLLLVAAAVLGIRSANNEARERQEGVWRFGSFVLDEGVIRFGVDSRPVTRSTHAEVAGSVTEGRRSTVTRTAAGGVVAGPVGALIGHAAKKKANTSSAVLTINGENWTRSVEVAPTQYRDAVRFAQAVNLAARRSSR
jgi:hypothetical protein